MLEIDHVILAVPSMDEALVWLADEYGLMGISTSADEGLIETAIVPFENAQYLEVLALKSSAVRSAPAASLAQRLARTGSHFWGFSVRISEIALVAERTGRPISSFEGRRVRSKTVRPPNDLANQLPFFIEYLGGTGDEYLKGLRQRSAGEPMGLRFAELSLSTDPTRLAEWLGVDLPILQVHAGESGLRSVAIETPKGTITISCGA